MEQSGVVDILFLGFCFKQRDNQMRKLQEVCRMALATRPRRGTGLHLCKLTSGWLAQKRARRGTQPVYPVRKQMPEP
jgi:hypothetical protein